MLTGSVAAIQVRGGGGQRRGLAKFGPLIAGRAAHRRRRRGASSLSQFAAPAHNLQQPYPTVTAVPLPGFHPMASTAMKLRLPATRSFVRTYATRLPQRPPYRAPDPLVNNPHAAYTELSRDVTFIHRPPPTAPSPLSYTVSPASPLLQRKAAPSDGPLSLPPTLHAETQRPWLSAEAIAEIRRLRKEDPAKWTRNALARKFNCTSLFVMKIAAADRKARREALEKRDKEHEAARSKWGEKKAFFKEAAKKRREFW